MIERAFNLHVKHLLVEPAPKSPPDQEEKELGLRDRTDRTTQNAPYAVRAALCQFPRDFCLDKDVDDGSSSLQAAVESTPLAMQLIPQDTGFDQLNFGRHSPSPSLLFS